MNGLGVPGAVLAGVSLGLAFCELGCESPVGARECVGCDLGWLDTGAAASALLGEADRCGVMISCGGRTWGALVGPLPPSRERVAAGVNGGECTAEAGGEVRGVPSPEPACIYLL